jgi:hypothetical protein
MACRHSIFILVALFAMAHSLTPVHAECLALTLDQEFKRSTAIFVGRAIAQSPVTTAANLTATETTFEVESLWKGQTKTPLRIRTCGGTVGDKEFTCAEGIRFLVGSRYIVFAEGAPLETSACSGTELLSQAEQTLQWLSHKPHKKGA